MINTMITGTIMLDNPAIAKNPNTDKTHNRSNIDAMTWSGRGRIPIAQATTARIRISHNVTGWLFIVKSTTSGILIPDIGAYPRNQRMISMMTMVINIIIEFVRQMA